MFFNRIIITNNWFLYMNVINNTDFKDEVDMADAGDVINIRVIG